jgi:diadenosine tetraphosphate (Ap4A) HIT family hydrolase
MPAAACYACRQEAGFDSLPPRERIAFDERWRVVHDFNTALPGWLVLLPRRHVTAIHDLTEAEAAALGSWQVRLSRALREVTGCVKTYVVQFAEQEGFAHTHFHVIPRMPDLPPELRGPAVFDFLSRPEPDRVSPADADTLALTLRPHLTPPM